MMTRRLVTVLVLSAAAFAALAAPAPSPYAQWKNGPPKSDDYFPIAVWLQDPRNAERFKAVGVNLYVGLWQGPTDAQLAALVKAGMPVICDQNDVGLKHKSDPIIVGWMHGDEPDNAQELPGGKGYGPPVKPEVIAADYRRIRAADPTRPVMLNLGQGVAWDNWYGRGVRSRHPEDYPEYVKGGDVVSFDIYPAVHDKPEVAGKLWFVAEGVTRLKGWAGDKRIVWNCIECTRIGNANVKPTPAQVRAEVWMSIIRGSRGIIWFVHQFKPKFIEAGLFADAEMTKAVADINAQVRALAAVINSPPLAEDAASVQSSSAETPVDIMARRHGGATYVFAAAMREGKTTAAFRVKGLAPGAKAEVLGEGRTLDVKNGSFSDAFEAYAVHLYRIK